MAEAVASQTPSLSEQYHLEKEVKQDTSAKPVEVKEVAPEVTTPAAEEVTTDQAKEESPVEEAVSAVEEKSESSPASTEVTSEAPAAVEDNAEETPAATEETNEEETSEEVAEETPAATEETNDEETSEEVAEETPDEIKLETAPADFRFPTTNQTRHCFTRYIEYHRCVAAKGDEAPECDKFAKFYRSLCPSEWVDRWNEQRENGTFPGPL